MSLAVVFSRAQDGVDAPLVTCEVHLSGGLPGTSIVGLPETAVKEARDRVRVAIQNAASVAALLITTEAMLAELPQKNQPMAMPQGGGGMGGMGF